MSVAPAGGNGTIMRTGRVGQLCASAACARGSHAQSAAASKPLLIREFLGVSDETASAVLLRRPVVLLFLLLLLRLAVRGPVLLVLARLTAAAATATATATITAHAVPRVKVAIAAHCD